MTEEQKTFVINTDGLADWAIEKIADETAETQRLVNAAQSRINEYSLKIEQYKAALERNTSFLRQQLRQYFETVPHKISDTQETYKLPAGTLKKKLPTLAYDRDEKVLGEFLKTNGYHESYYTETIKPNWAELKKWVVVKGNRVYDPESGEELPGVEVKENPTEFIIDI